MNVLTKQTVLGDIGGESELTDFEIEQLLTQAEDRLRKQQQQLTITNSNKFTSALPHAAKLDVSTLPKPYVQIGNDVARADPRRLVDENQRQLANAIRKVEDPITTRQKLLEEKKATAGPAWYNLPKTNLTPELKRDLQLLSMRSVLDPKRFYKKENSKAKAPEFSQVGTLIEGPTDFYSGRLSNRDRKRTLVEEIMAGEKASGRFARKYSEIQAAKTGGKKGHYKAKMAKKYGSKLRT